GDALDLSRHRHDSRELSCHGRGDRSGSEKGDRGEGASVLLTIYSKCDEGDQYMTTQTLQASEGLKGTLKGSILVPDDPGYEEARQIWNAMIDRRPAVIAQCVQADDVPPVIRLARKNGLQLSIRGGGHNIAGNALCDNGVTIDFSRMKKVRVDAGKRRAYVEPGATLADLDEAAQAHGLATPVGINSTTG